MSSRLITGTLKMVARKRYNSLQYLLLLVVAITPLVSPIFGLGYEESKVLFFILLTTVAGFIWVKNYQISWIIFKKPSFIFLVALFITSVLGIDPKASFLGRPPYFQGFIVYGYLFIFSVMVSLAKISVRSWSMILGISSLLVAIWAIKDWILLNVFQFGVPTYAGRVVSSFGQPNFYAGFILLSLPFYLLLSDFFKKKAQVIWIFGLIIEIVGIFISQSRAAVLLLPAVLLIWSMIKVKNKLMLGAVMIITGFVLIMAVYLSANFSSGIIWQEITKPQLATTVNPNLWTDSAEKRFYIWPVVWELINQKPFLGYGLENIEPAFTKYFEVNKHQFFEANNNPSSVLIRLKDVGLDRTHSFGLDVLMFGGLLGFLTWGLLIYSSARQAELVLWASLMVYLVWSQFQNQSIVHLLYFWLLIGLIDKGGEE